MPTPPSPTPEDFVVARLGPPAFQSPLPLATVWGQGLGTFVPDAARVRYQVEMFTGNDTPENLLFEKAGPREQIFFSPAQTRAAIVTCGGLCPGLNNVIRSAFLELHHNYGVPDVLGIRYGFEGLNPAVGQPPLLLTTAMVDSIHEEGGTILGSSRGPQEPEVMVDALLREKINLLLCVGGDGTQRGAHDLAAAVQRRGVNIAVVGVPKTIDNDLHYVWRTFGISTAVAEAREVLDCAHNEARGVNNGVGLVKVMGRDAGFIAALATLASQEVNFTLVPEVPFALDGERGFLAALERRLRARQHAVVVVAEGAGQELLGAPSAAHDASGNRQYGDIGLFLKEQILTHCKRRQMPVSVKYFDPSYAIRSVEANCDDAMLCDRLARHAVHAAMAGKTDVLVGNWANAFTLVPIPVATRYKKRVLPEGSLWQGVLAATGQPRQFV